MLNESHDASRDDPRTVREKIADALIPRHQSRLRVSYLVFGNDAVLLRFLSIPEYDGSASQFDAEYQTGRPDSLQPRRHRLR
jgi:hypothetical protein